MEAQVLTKVVGKDVTKVSMHRPSKEIIGADLKIPGIINTYGSKYFKEYKYLSDSRRRWREPVIDLINRKQYERFQILVHPFWYNENELSLQDTVYRFINSANGERYHSLSENFTDLSDVMKESDVRGV